MINRAEKFLTDVSGRYAGAYFAAVHDLYAATVLRNAPQAADARKALATAMMHTMGAAEVLGAMMMLESASRSAQFAADQPILPRVTLTEALEDLVTRAPKTLKNAAQRTAQRIAQLYTEDRVMAFVRAAEETVTTEAQTMIARAFRDGLGETEAGKSIAFGVNRIRQESEPWSRGYSKLVFRNNVNTGVTAGRFRQAQDPDIKSILPAFRFDAIGDGDTRDNHEAADGIIMSVDNPEWRKIAPPIGHNCRCMLSAVSVDELRDMGRIRADGSMVQDKVPTGAFPDPGFRHGGRPDLAMNAS
jgi:SPP1 gp7 family putative phage head morphogenesis protein